LTRLSLDELRRIILRNLSDEWRTPSQFRDAFLRSGHKLGIGGWERIALTLERLANDGLAEIRIRGNRRYYRRSA
jgi:DNA-binding transcriptional ArsR family regulator